MAQDRIVLLKNKQTGEIIRTTKNKKGVERKLKLKKFSKKLKKRVEFTESKK
jgi:large subunit ribosomal protein L33